MSYAKALNPLEEQRSQATKRWLAAQDEHSKACACFYRIRKQLPPKGKMNGAQMELYEIAKVQLSQATKKRAEEEQIYNQSMNPLLSKPIDEFKDALQEQIVKFFDQVRTMPMSSVMDLKSAREEQSRTIEFETRAKHSPVEAKLQQEVMDYAIARAEGRIDAFNNILQPGETAYTPKPLNRALFDMPAPIEPEESKQPQVEEPPDPFGDPINDAAMDTDPDPPLERVVVPETPLPLETPIQAPKAKASPQIKKLGLDSESLREHPLFSEEAARAAAAYIPPVIEPRMSYQSISREEWEQSEEYKQIQEQLQKEQTPPTP